MSQLETEADQGYSPDALDEALRVVKPAGWLAVITCGLVIGAGLLWSVFGSYRVTVKGQGLIHAEDGIFVEVFAPKEGWLDYLAPIGQTVQRGQLIAKLEAPESSKTLAGLNQRAQQLAKRREGLGLRYQERMEGEARSSAALRSSLQAAVQQGSKKLDQLQQQLATADASQADTLRERSYDAQQEISRLRSQLLELDKPISDLKVQRDQELEEVDRQMQEFGIQLDAAKLALDLATQVYAQDAGRVVMAPVALHSLVPGGKSIMTLETGADGLEVIAYLPADQGKNVVPGMSVRISPTNVQREEFGSLLGRVISVSPLPQSRIEVVNTLANEDLAKIFTEDGPPIAIRVALIPDPITPSGYRWTSNRGSQLVLTSGTLVNIWITVEDAPPITLIIPELAALLED
ncbi:MAG: NHLP bacteriocin system secretion protein [Pseudomonadota bacterium]